MLYAKRISLVLDSVAIAFCLYAFMLAPSPFLLLPIAVFGLAIGAVVAPQKPAFEAAAIILCVIVGILGVITSIYLLFSDSWEGALLGKYTIAGTIFVVIGLGPLLSAQVIRHQDRPSRPIN